MLILEIDPTTGTRYVTEQTKGRTDYKALVVGDIVQYEEGWMLVTNVNDYGIGTGPLPS